MPRAPWADIEQTLRVRAYCKIADMPEYLLEQDSWFDVDADLYYARLIGYEDEVVQDVRVRRPEPEILMPLHQRLTMASFTSSIEIEPLRTASYRLQSCFVTLSVSGELYDIPVPKLRPDNTAVVAYLRYRRRS